MGSLLPPSPFARPFVRRTVAVWLFVRVAALAGAGATLRLYSDLDGMAGPSTVPIGSLRLAFVTALVVVAVIMADLVRRSETLFLANLGWSGGSLALGAFLICAVLEGALRIAVGW